MRSPILPVILGLLLAACSDIEPTAPAKGPAIQFASAPAFGVDFDLENFLGVPGIETASQFGDPFRHQIAAQLENQSNVVRILSRWLTTLIRAKVRPASNDNELFLVLSDYQDWLLYANSLVTDTYVEFAAEIDVFRSAIAPVLTEAINANLTLCGTNQSFAGLANALLWYGQAEEIGLDGTSYWTVTNDVLLASVSQHCLNVSVDTVQFPDPVDVGQSFTLRTVSSVTFVGQTTSRPAAFAMDIIYNPPFTSLASAFTDANGLYETPLSFPLEAVVTLRAAACLVLPARTVQTPVCAVGSRSGNVLAPPPPPPPPPPPTVDVSGTWEADFSYTPDNGQTIVPARITIVLSAGGGGTWSLDDGVHSGSISFSVGGIDPACPGCGYKISNFDMRGGFPGFFFMTQGWVGDPALGRSIAMDLLGQDGHGGGVIVHTWFERRVLLRPVVP
jgi:hypothetical protein